MIKFFDRTFTEKLNICSALVHLFGVNRVTAERLCSFAGISLNVSLRKIPMFKFRELENFTFFNFNMERQLRFEYRSNLEAKIKKGLYSGLRVQQNLPSRGQRTRSNARIAKVSKK